jgi:hypothetical protein
MNPTSIMDSATTWPTRWRILVFTLCQKGRVIVTAIVRCNGSKLPLDLKRSFGQEISGNRRKGQELFSDVCSEIISKFEAGIGMSELADEFCKEPG